MIVEIPTRSLPAYNFEITLEGVIYRLYFRWNSRFEFWVMDFQDRQGESILAGLKLVLDYELIRMFASDRLPKGALIAVDSSRRLTRIGENDLGDPVKLLYIPRADLNEILGVEEDGAI